MNWNAILGQIVAVIMQLIPAIEALITQIEGPGATPVPAPVKAALADMKTAAAKMHAAVKP